MAPVLSARDAPAPSCPPCACTRPHVATCGVLCMRAFKVWCSRGSIMRLSCAIGHQRRARWRRHPSYTGAPQPGTPSACGHGVSIALGENTQYCPLPLSCLRAGETAATPTARRRLRASLRSGGCSSRGSARMAAAMVCAVAIPSQSHRLRVDAHCQSTRLSKRSARACAHATDLCLPLLQATTPGLSCLANSRMAPTTSGDEQSSEEIETHMPVHSVCGRVARHGHLASK